MSSPVYYFFVCVLEVINDDGFVDGSPIECQLSLLFSSLVKIRPQFLSCANFILNLLVRMLHRFLHTHFIGTVSRAKDSAYSAHF